jgi:hypothetical protein
VDSATEYEDTEEEWENLQDLKKHPAFEGF